MRQMAGQWRQPPGQRRPGFRAAQQWRPSLHGPYRCCCIRPRVATGGVAEAGASLAALLEGEVRQPPATGWWSGWPAAWPCCEPVTALEARLRLEFRGEETGQSAQAPVRIAGLIPTGRAAADYGAADGAENLIADHDGDAVFSLAPHLLQLWSSSARWSQAKPLNSRKMLRRVECRTCCGASTACATAALAVVAGVEA